VIEAPGHPTTTRWNVFLVHNDHEHGEPAITTPEAVVTLSPVHSHTESYSYRIVLTVTDDLGATDQREVRLFPNASNVLTEALLVANRRMLRAWAPSRCSTRSNGERW
jgi:hypothetical protein